MLATMRPYVALATQPLDDEGMVVVERVMRDEPAPLRPGPGTRHASANLAPLPDFNSPPSHLFSYHCVCELLLSHARIIAYAPILVQSRL